MAKFCTKCGKEIEEGKTCSCEKEVKRETSKTEIDIKESFIDCLNIIKKIFVKPFETVEKFAVENKFISGIIFIVTAAIATGIQQVALLKNAYSTSSIDSFNVDDISSIYASISDYAKEPEYIKEFLTTSLTNLATYALVVGIGYLIISKLLKGKATIKEMVSAVGLSFVVVIMVNLINSVLMFVDGNFIADLRGYLSIFANILSICILAEAVKKVANIDKNKIYITVASMSVLAVVVIDILQNITK